MLKEPNCYTRKCRHFIGASPHIDETLQVPICSAFPKGIPSEIAYGTNLHLAPYKGDNGIQYEKA